MAARKNGPSCRPSPARASASSCKALKSISTRASVSGYSWAPLGRLLAPNGKGWRADSAPIRRVTEGLASLGRIGDGRPGFGNAPGVLRSELDRHASAADRRLEFIDLQLTNLI